MKFQIEVIKSKIHRVTVTQADLNYVGSITIDEELIDAANMIEGEKVQVLDVDNGERLETYIIKGERGSGAICLNGPAARKVQVGDVVIIASYALLTCMMAQVCGLQPGEFIHTLGDTHLYLNHLEQVDEQLSREPRPLPKLRLNPAVKSVFDFRYEDFTLEGYDPWPAIKAPMSF